MPLEAALLRDDGGTAGPALQRCMMFHGGVLGLTNHLLHEMLDNPFQVG